MSLQSKARQRPTIGWTRTRRSEQASTKLPPFNVTEFQDTAHRANRMTLTKKVRGAFGKSGFRFAEVGA